MQTERKKPLVKRWMRREEIDGGAVGFLKRVKEAIH